MSWCAIWKFFKFWNYLFEMQYRVKDTVREDTLRQTMDDLREELGESLQHEEHRDNVDAAKKRAVRQGMDYDGFKQMVLGADLKPVKSEQMRALVDVTSNKIYDSSIVNSSAGTGLSKNTQKAVVENPHDIVKMLPSEPLSLQKPTPVMVEPARTYLDMKRGFDKILGKSSILDKSKNEIILIEWLQTIQDGYIDKIVCLDFDVYYLNALVDIMSRWQKHGKYTERAGDFKWFIIFLDKVAQLDSFLMAVKPTLKTADKSAFRKLIDAIAIENEEMAALCQDLKAAYTK